MKHEVLFRLRSQSRDDFTIQGFRFGKGSPEVALIAGMRGHEVQQVAVASRLVRELEERERLLSPGTEILVIPAANPYSLNIAKKFWGLDNTDINRMYPGYEAGETTQRIAHRLMKVLTGFRYGINLTSINHPGEYANHVRVHRTGYVSQEEAGDFGLQFLHVHEPSAQETGTLNYNWQVWNTRAYSLLGGRGFEVNQEQVEETVLATLRFLMRRGLLGGDPGGGFPTEELTDERMHRVWTEEAGLWLPRKKLGDQVLQGEPLGVLTNPLTGRTSSTVVAPVSGRVFYRAVFPLLYQRMVAYTLV